MEKISCVIITLNEEANLKRSLTSLRGIANEIIIVDSGSTDGTLKIAKSFGAKILHREFDGYGSQKKWAVEQAKYDWILSLDADEELTPKLVSEIKKFMDNPTSLSGMKLPRVTYFMGKTINFLGKPELIVRLFRKDKGGFNTKPVHESIELQGKTSQFSSPINHHSFRDIEHYIKKANLYSSLDARNMLAEGKKPKSLLELLMRAPIRFMLLYFFRCGFLYGKAGFAWSFLLSIFPVIKYLKLQEYIYLSHK